MIQIKAFLGGSVNTKLCVIGTWCWSWSWQSVLKFQSIFSPPFQRFWMILVHKVATLVLAHCIVCIVCSFTSHLARQRQICFKKKLANLLHQYDSQIFQFYPRKCVNREIFGQKLRMEEALVVLEWTKIKMSWMDKIAFHKYRSIRLKVLYHKMARNLGESITLSAVGSSINCSIYTSSILFSDWNYNFSWWFIDSWTF